MTISYSIVDILLMFFIYAFLGWSLEIAYNGVKEGHYVNRGFLNGPVCPIYGVGGTVVVLCLTPLKEHILVLFVVSIVICTLIELVTGFLLEKIYKTRWWDYSDKPLNIGGYICPEFSLYWGVACLFLMYGLHPLIFDGTLFKLPNAVKYIIAAVAAAIFLTDMSATVITLKNLKQHAEKLADMGAELLGISERLGHAIYDRADAVDKEVDRKREEFENSERSKQLTARYNELKAKYDASVADARKYTRILTAFKNATSERFGDVFDKIRAQVSTD